MSEIEKMYENAGIVPKKNCYYWDCPYSTGNVGEDDKKEKDCENCNNPDKKTYPPFTAEKQLEILQMFCKRYLELSQYVEDNGDLIFGIKTTVGDFAVSFSKDFAECLAGFVNFLWQDLTEEERNSIKEILE